jgi:hypothetical protein
MADQRSVVMLRRLSSIYNANFVRFARRPVFQLTVEGQSERLHFNDPTAVAVASLSIVAISSGALVLDSFLGAGGALAIIRVLNESRCPLTAAYALGIFTGLMEDAGLPGRQSESRDLACTLFRSGEL